MFIALAFFIIISALQWKHPAIEDEVLFHRDAFSWVTQGANAHGLSHTPLYWEALRWWQKLWGVADPNIAGSVAILRSLGTFSALLTFGIFVWGLKRLRAPASGYLFAIVLLVHPYFIQSSLLLDIDNTLLIPTLLLWVILVELWTSKPNGSWPLTFAIALTFAVALMLKELTPLLCLPLWVFYVLLKPRRAHLKQALAGCVLGVTLFCALLWIWSRLTGLEFLAPFRVTIDKIKTGHGNTSGTPWATLGLARFLFLDYLPILWLGLPLLFGLWLESRKKLFKWPPTLPLLFAAGVLWVYSWIVQSSFYFPKYSAITLVLLLFGVAVRAPFPKARPFYPVLAALFVIGLVPNLDPFMITEWRDLTSEKIHFIYHGMAIALPCAGLYWLHRRHASVLLGLVASLAGLSLGQALRERNTAYLYGEAGFQETIHAVRALKDKVSKNEPVLSAAQDVAWNMGRDARYTELHFYDDENGTPLASKIVVSRTYGMHAVVNQPHAKKDAETRYPCHRFVNAPGRRFEWWWKPLPGQGCDS